jgi:membrane-bound serine protease (ClpP class)
VILALKWLPRTAMGRRVLLTAPKSEDVLPEDQRREWLRSRVGQVAVAKCKMLPAGAIILDGRTVDAVSEGMPIEAGQKVRVIEVRGNRVVVRAIEEETPTASAEDPLRRPIDSVAPDPFQQPPD